MQVLNCREKSEQRSEGSERQGQSRSQGAKMSRQLVALHEVPKGNLWRQLSDRVLLLFE